MASKRKRNIIPLNIVQKHGSKKYVSKELLAVSVHSTAQQASCSLAVQHERTEDARGDFPNTTEDINLMNEEGPSHYSGNLDTQTSQPENERQLKLSQKWQECVPNVFKALGGSWHETICRVCVL